jgi:DNA-binding beta-propeller fold protein YncE
MDADTRAQIAETATRSHARGLAVSADGGLAAAIHDEDLMVWEVSRDALIPLFAGPLPDGRALCFVDRRTLVAAAYGGLVRIDLHSGESHALLQVPAHRLVWSPVHHRMAALGSRRITVFSPQDPTTTRHDLALTSRPSHAACNPSTGDFWVTLPEEEQIAIVSADGVREHRLSVAGGPAGIGFDAAGRTAFVACPAEDAVLGIDAASGRTTMTVSIHGDGSELSALPTALAVAPDGDRVFVACHRGEFLAVLDVPRARVAHRLALPAGNSELALLPGL